jgi:hypothetical protein
MLGFNGGRSNEFTKSHDGDEAGFLGCTRLSSISSLITRSDSRRRDLPFFWLPDVSLFLFRRSFKMEECLLRTVQNCFGYARQRAGEIQLNRVRGQYRPSFESA